MRRQGMLVIGLLALGWLMVGLTGWIQSGPSLLFWVGVGISTAMQLFVLWILWRSYGEA